MKKIVFFFLIGSAVGYCQLSPGDLTKAHSEFEGMSNCTLCHDLGEKVSNIKCLDCHEKISNLLDQNKGYHANDDILKKDCFECHSDHHGVKFEMIRFDEDKFDHELTGYLLEGKHKVIDCRDCHTSDFIEDKDLKKKEDTFLGLEINCLACHEDYHQETLSSNDCISCHDTEAFSPAPYFDHNETDFALKGKHQNIDCKLCHEISTKNDQEFQQFNDIPFNDCKVCHEDPHILQIRGQCKQCHTEKSFSTFIGKGNFNHDYTDFILKGRHKKIDCFSCHEKTSNPELVFQNVKKVEESSCIECHSDIHEGKLGNDCASCHNENNFTAISSLDLFNHKFTDYPLEGMHATVDCKQCHTGKFTEAIDFSACFNCHEDYHLGEFKKVEYSPDCIECHTLEKSFEYSIYTIEKHQTATFPLEGAHNATPCFSCHISEDDKRWSFKNLGTQCIDCHQDIHHEVINKEYYPDNKCTICHVNETWSIVNFDHGLTSWPIEGKHIELNCRECHFDISKNKIAFNQSLNTIECVQCHDNIHGEQFAVDNVTDCTKCHHAGSWFPENFNHNETAFQLEGSHKLLACTECHIADIENEQTRIIYKTEKIACIDCHL